MQKITFLKIVGSIGNCFYNTVMGRQIDETLWKHNMVMETQLIAPALENLKGVLCWWNDSEWVDRSWASVHSAYLIKTMQLFSGKSTVRWYQ